MLKKPKYTGVKIRIMLRGMKYKEVQSLLTLSQKDIISHLDNCFSTNKFLTYSEACILWKMFDTFIFKDKRN